MTKLKRIIEFNIERVKNKNEFKKLFQLEKKFFMVFFLKFVFVARSSHMSLRENFEDIYVENVTSLRWH